MLLPKNSLFRNIINDVRIMQIYMCNDIYYSIVHTKNMILNKRYREWQYKFKGHILEYYAYIKMTM